jgi:hypothetical protein
MGYLPAISRRQRRSWIASSLEHLGLYVLGFAVLAHQMDLQNHESTACGLSSPSAAVGLRPSAFDPQHSWHAAVLGMLSRYAWRRWHFDHEKARPSRPGLLVIDHPQWNVGGEVRRVDQVPAPARAGMLSSPSLRMMTCLLSSTSTTALSPSPIRPERNSSARESSSSRITARRSGRAP